MEAAGPADNRKAECPNCLGVLAKVPGRKTKCPHCGQYMYVRTRPDSVRVVVTEQEADRIDEEWALLSDIPPDPSIAEGEGSDNASRWESLNRELTEFASNQDWGLYRNCRNEMADQLMRESEFQRALNLYLEVIYLDQNGPQNCGGYVDAEFLKEFPPFDLTLAFLAPGMVDLIQRLGRRLEISLDDIKTAYIEHNASVHRSLALPKSPESTWPDLANALSRLHDLL